MKKLLHHKATWILAAALSLALIFAALASLFPSWIGGVQGVTQTLTRPFQLAAGAVSRNIAHLYGQAAEFEALRLENERLSTELAQVKELARDGSLAVQENERLRSLLDFKNRHHDLQLTPAKLLFVGSSSWTRVLTLAKGSADDLALRDCVVDAQGNLVGVISSLSEHAAEVTLVTDAAFQLPGEAPLQAARGLLCGDLALMPDGLLKLSYLPRETTLSPGDEVLTLSTEGLYPSGLLVGTVQKVEQDAGGLSAYALLSPAAHLAQFDQLFVITDFTMED